MALKRIFVGIDVAKDWLDLWLAPSNRFERIANGSAGWAQLVALLEPLGAGVVVAFEATGGYEDGLRRTRRALPPGVRRAAA